MAEFDEMPNFSLNIQFEEEWEEKQALVPIEENQPASKKARFAALESQELDEVVENSEAKRTKYATKWGISVVEEWCQERSITKKLEDMDYGELDLTLRQFYAEARNKKGENYGRSTLLALRYAVERHLNGPPLNRGIKLSKNPAFARSNQMLDAQLKQLKQAGKENACHKPPIENEDLVKLKTSPTLLPSEPLGLLRNVWFHTSLYWCRRGREGQRSLKKSSFTFNNDATGRRFATMTHDESTKNHQGGIGDIESFEKLGRMYASDSPTDGYSALRQYLERLNPDCGAFFQYPKRYWKPNDLVWYENRPLGVNKLSSMMKEISAAADLSHMYTNHSVRATAITLWSDAGLPNRQIMALSGHRNESSLRSYHSRPSANHLRQCSDVLSSALDGKERENVNPSEELGVVSVSARMNQTTKTSNRSERNVDVGSMFAGCTINKVEINFNG